VAHPVAGLGVGIGDALAIDVGGVQGQGQQGSKARAKQSGGPSARTGIELIHRRLSLVIGVAAPWGRSLRESNGCASRSDLSAKASVALAGAVRGAVAEAACRGRPVARLRQLSRLCDRGNGVHRPCDHRLDVEAAIQNGQRGQQAWRPAGCSEGPNDKGGMSPGSLGMYVALMMPRPMRGFPLQVVFCTLKNAYRCTKAQATQLLFLVQGFRAVCLATEDGDSNVTQ